MLVKFTVETLFGGRAPGTVGLGLQVLDLGLDHFYGVEGAPVLLLKQVVVDLLSYFSTGFGLHTLQEIVQSVENVDQCHLRVCARLVGFSKNHVVQRLRVDHCRKSDGLTGRNHGALL